MRLDLGLRSPASQSIFLHYLLASFRLVPFVLFRSSCSDLSLPPHVIRTSQTAIILNLLHAVTDSLECLIRPKRDNYFPTKSEAARIHQVALAARLRIKSAHRNIISSSPRIAISQSLNVISSTPNNESGIFTQSSTPTGNRFASLSNPTHKNSVSSQ